MNREGTILIVEDNTDDIFFMERAFKSAAIVNPVQVVQDGEAALDYLSGKGEFTDRAKYPLPYLMLLDLKLPIKSGHEVLAWTRKQDHLARVVVIILSTSAESGDIDKAYQLGANAYLMKPSNPTQLVVMVSAIKTFWLEQNVRSLLGT